MAHASGNATWVDYPSVATLISAATLENQENLLDRAAQVVGSTNTNAIVCESRATANYPGLAAIANYTLTGQMAPPSGGDPRSMWSGGGTNNRFKVTLPVAGRYEAEWTVLSSQTTGGGTAYILKNLPSSVTSVSDDTAITSYSLFAGGFVLAAGAAVGVARGTEVFAAGDTLSLGFWSSVVWDMQTTRFGNLKTKFVVRYLGPS